MKRHGLATTAVLSIALWTLSGTGIAAQTTPDTPTQPGQTPPATTTPQQTEPSSTTPRAATPRADSASAIANVDRKFLEEVAHGNAAEIMEGRLALEKSNDAALKRAAQKIIADHEKAQQEVQQLAQSYNITVPSEPNPLQQASYTHLSKLSGAAFDKMYIAGQIQAHENTINLFHKITQVGNSVEVRQFAKTTLPALAAHAESLRPIARRMGVPATFGRPAASELARGMNSMKAANAARMKSRN